MQREKVKGILFLLIFIPVSFGIFIYLMAHPIGEGSVETYHVNIIYQDHQNNYNGELAQCAGEVIEECSFGIKFYNLTVERDYFVMFSNGETILRYPPNEKPIIIFMQAKKGNWCHLGSNNRDLVWIQILEN